MNDEKPHTRELPKLHVEDVNNRITSDGDMISTLDMQKLHDPIEITTADTTYCLSPTSEDFQWQVTSDKYKGEIVAVLGSYRQDEGRTALIKDRLVVGLQMVMLRETGAKIVTSPIQSFQVVKTKKSDSKYDPGTVLEDRYQLVELIGRGGAGAVYRALHLRLGRSVAIKIIETNEKQSPELVEQLIQRFHREIKLLTHINHPYITSIIDQGITPKNDPFMVMEFIEGDTLRRYIKNNFPLNFRQVLKLFRQLGIAVQALHDAGIIHRDLKPDNVIVQRLQASDEIVRLLDFGIAKMVHGEAKSGRELTQAGTVMGTVDYMSPEQCQGRPVSYRADIYSLGVILFEMITGALPFTAPTPLAVLMKHIQQEAPPITQYRPEAPPALAAVVARALQKEPEDRYNDVLALITALDHAL